MVGPPGPNQIVETPRGLDASRCRRVLDVAALNFGRRRDARLFDKRREVFPELSDCCFEGFTAPDTRLDSVSHHQHGAQRDKNYRG